MKTNTHLTILLMSIVSSFVMAQNTVTPPSTEGFIPFEENGGGGATNPTTVNGQTVSCIEMIKFQRHQAGKSIGSDSQEVDKSARQQTRTDAVAGLGLSAGTGIAVGLITGNPIIGAGVFGGMGLLTAVDTGIERSKIKRNGNAMIAAEKIQSGEALTRKENRAFEKMRKKVSRKVYRNKNELRSEDFAYTINQQAVASENNGQSINGENLFCDVDRKGRVVIKPQDRQTIKRLALAQKCNNDKGRTISVTKRL